MPQISAPQGATLICKYVNIHIYIYIYIYIYIHIRHARDPPGARIPRPGVLPARSAGGAGTLGLWFRPTCQQVSRISLNMSWPFSYRVDPETQLEFACTCLLFVLFQCQSITDHYLVKTILSVVLVQQLCCANMSLLCKTCPWNLLVPAALCKHYDFVCVAPSGVCKHCANILCRFCALCMICPSANISIA